MLYAIIAEDTPNCLAKRKDARDRHLARLTALQEAGHLILAGPHPAIDTEEPGEAGFSGSLIVAQFASLDAAQEWANNDPYIEAGVYEKVTVKPFKQVLPIQTN